YRLVFRRRLHRKVGGPLALEDAIDVTSSLTERFGLIRAERDQSAGRDVAAERVHSGQTVAGGECDYQVALRLQQLTHYDQAAISAGELCHGALQFFGIATVNRRQLHPKRRRNSLDGSKLASRKAGNSNDRRAGHTRSNLFEQFEPFPA